MAVHGPTTCGDARSCPQWNKASKCWMGHLMSYRCCNFAQSHDQRLWQCLCTIMDVPADGCDPVTRASSLALLSWWLGFEERARTRAATYWASWSDTLPMIHSRHPAVANLRHLESDSWSPTLRTASQAATGLDGLQGFEKCHHGAAFPRLRRSRTRRISQWVATRSVEESGTRLQRESVHQHVTERQGTSDHRVARSRGRILCLSVSMLTRIDAPLLRVLVQRASRWQKKFALEKRTCKGLQGNKGVPSAGDNRRLEVVVDSRAQLAVDTTLVGQQGEWRSSEGTADWEVALQRRVASKRERTQNWLIKPQSTACGVCS